MSAAAFHQSITPMPNDSDPQSIAELLRALDDVREAAKRVDRDYPPATEGRESAPGENEPEEEL